MLLPSASFPGAAPDFPTIELQPTVEFGAPAQSGEDQSPVKLTTGEVLRQRYVLEEVIGRGGHCIVYRARDLHRVATEDPGTGCIALKVLNPSHRGNERAIARLQREFRQMQTLAHPNVARVFDLDCDGDIWFISMELMDGESLSQRLRKPVGIAEAMHIIGACSLALDYAHSMGIVHGDLKPSNVLLASDGRVKLIDFGSVPSRGSIIDADSRINVATPCYASPQVLAGMRAEPGDDIFSLAALSYGILAEGERPFGGKNSLEAHRARLCPEVVPGMPVEIFAALARSLAGDRELRASSAAQFHCDLLGPAAATLARSRRNGALENGAMPRASSSSLRRLSMVGMAVGAVCAGLLIMPAAQKIIAATTGAHVSIPPVSKVLLPAADAAAAPHTTLVTDETAPSTVELAPRLAGTISFESPSIVAGSAQSMVAIPVKRTQSIRGQAAVEWEVESGSAHPNIDYQPTPAQIVRFNDGETARSLFIPLLRTSAEVDPRPPRTFWVALRRVGGGAHLGAVTRIKVTIVPQAIFSDGSNQLAILRSPAS